MDNPDLRNGAGAIRIDPPIRRTCNGWTELRATLHVGTRMQDVWFRTDLAPDQTDEGVEPFISLALLPAMQLGVPLVTQMPVSPLFMEQQRLIQKYFHGWDANLALIDVCAPLRSSCETVANGRVAAFFSGGVDSFHTAHKHRAEINDLVFVQGFDIGLNESGFYESIYERIAPVAQAMQKHLIRIQTNLRVFTDSLAHWALHEHGPALAAVGQWLAPRCRKVLIPGEYFPLVPSAWPRGSQPQTDPLFSTERVRIVHDGYRPTRVGKIKAIIHDPLVQQSLRVCWENRGGAYNCGQCSKCLRNMAAIRAFGLLGQCITFPPTLDLEALSRLDLRLGEWRGLAEEVLAILEEECRDPELAAALRICLRRNDRRIWRDRLAVWRDVLRSRWLSSK